ncbi:NAD(P)H-binding protein [uncultured Capnocytophaga sp.]|uniref:NAD(P)H-binding protein n=1 Tax=uncultured Capnocytophaga sp. TaxID=159273 RepID=UPI00261EE0E0|nr:NAD(P)H-binding protein [uncultured Capnocytophaga sp.]
MKTEKILLAGATGYLGQYILAALLREEYPTRIVVRNKSKLSPALLTHPLLEVVEAEVTQPDTLQGVCKGVHKVISTVGITRQKDGLTHEQVDFQANKNLLDEALREGVRKFIYVSVFKGEAMRHIAIGAAKERFVDALKASGLDYCIIRPSVFYSYMTLFFKMAKAKKDEILLFGKGQYAMNPIHGEDLAEVCVAQLERYEREVNVGGAEIFTQTEIACLAFEVLHKPANISYLPDWVRRLILKMGKYLLPKSIYGAIEFFLTTMAMDVVAPMQVGKHRLKAFFESINSSAERKYFMNYLKRLKQSGEFEYSLGANAEEIKHIEEELGILLPEVYVNFLSECGSCNYGDVYINGIYKEKDSISYPVVELTKQLREDLHLSEDFIVLHYEVDEFLTLYKVSNKVRLKDTKVFEAEVYCNDKGAFEIEKPTPMFDSFEEYFEDFLDLAEED